jgi:hypothetical protein
MQGSGIAWPQGPYRLADGQTWRRVRWGGWALILGAALLVALAHGRDRWVPQNLADLAATLGLGRTVAGASVESWNCGPYQRDTFIERAHRGIRHQCLVRVRGSVTHDYEFRTGYSAAYAPGRVASVGGRIAVAWPGWVMLERLTDLAVSVVIALGMVGFGALMLRYARQAARFERATARIVDADLLCRRMFPKSALWDFAYEIEGRRVLARGPVEVDPVITDGVVTRGAAVVASGGGAQLLTVADAESLGEPVRAGITQAFHARRLPLDAGFAELVTRTPSGPERAYVEAFGRAWHDPDVAQVNAAILARHEAALALPPARVEALLRDCRRFIVSG